MKYHSERFELLTSVHNLDQGQCPVGIEPMNKNKYKHVSECFKDVTVDGKRGIGKATIEKVCFFLV